MAGLFLVEARQCVKKPVLTNSRAYVTDAAWATAFRRQLLAWYRRTARDLPWRRTRDPYAIWVSEIMLQQTQVATVIDYFQRLLTAFPDVEALAAADEQQVLRLWEGLGYYRRARQLHAAAKLIVARHGGCFPRAENEVLALPGIGRYTAGAIRSIAFDARAPILEANTVRLVSRLLGYRGDPRLAAGQRRLWAAAEAWLPPRGAGQFNQAMMELGSQVCTPRAPRCAHCPVFGLCATGASGNWRKIPRPPRPTRWESVEEAAVVVWRGTRFLAVRCPAGQRWAGLWDVPRLTLDGAEHHTTQPHAEPGAARQRVEQLLRDLLGIRVEVGDEFHQLRHGVTRFRIRLTCFAGRAPGVARPQAAEWRWVTPDEWAALPLNVTARRIARLLVAGHGRFAAQKKQRFAAQKKQRFAANSKQRATAKTKQIAAAVSKQRATASSVRREIATRRGRSATATARKNRSAVRDPA